VRPSLFRVFGADGYEPLFLAATSTVMLHEDFQSLTCSVLDILDEEGYLRSLDSLGLNARTVQPALGSTQ
jgi:hypothetical protein